MKSIINILIIAMMLLSVSTTYVHILNSKQIEFNLFCYYNMCRNTIKSAENINNSSLANWSKNVRVTTIKFKQNDTSDMHILENTALNQHDNHFLNSVLTSRFLSLKK